jgi:hypothetical protein
MTMLGGLMLSPGAVASDLEVLVGGHIEKLRSFPDLHLTISVSCQKDDKKEFACSAYDAAKRASMKRIPSKLRVGGADPGALVCIAEGGMELIGMYKDSAQDAFCKFKDGSLIGTGSLHYHARQNDGQD